MSPEEMERILMLAERMEQEEQVKEMDEKDVELYNIPTRKTIHQLQLLPQATTQSIIHTFPKLSSTGLHFFEKYSIMTYIKKEKYYG